MFYKVPSKYIALKPKSYTNFENHVDQVKIEKIKEEEKRLKGEEKSARRKKGGKRMDTESEQSHETEETITKPSDMDSTDSQNT